MSLEPSKVITQNGEEWCTFHRQFLIPQTATFCIAMDAKRNSSFAAKIKKGVRNMRSTFNILFYVNKSKEKNGVVPVMGRVTIFRRTDMSMLELTPEFIKDFAAYLSTERGLANGTIWQRCMKLKTVMTACGIEKAISYHCGRHSFTTLALSKGMPIESVSRVLGHTNIVTTQINARITCQKLDNDLTMLGNKLTHHSRI